MLKMIEIRVAFADTDAMGVVHHANYLKYFEVARVGCLRELGVNYRDWQNKGFHLPLIQAQCNYKKPARFEDLLEIDVTLSRKKFRFIFEYKVKNKTTNETLTTGSTTHVSVDNNMKLIDPPDDIVKAFSSK